MHARSASFAGPNGQSSQEAKRVYSQPEIRKYAEDDDEDYDDVFGKPNGAGERERFLCVWIESFVLLMVGGVGSVAFDADFAA